MKVGLDRIRDHLEEGHVGEALAELDKLRECMHENTIGFRLASDGAWLEWCNRCGAIKPCGYLYEGEWIGTQRATSDGSHPNAQTMIKNIDREWVKRVESKRAQENWERENGPFPLDRIPPEGATITTLRSLVPGDCFKFLKVPPGWSPGKLVLVDQAPGWAMPEGWDFVLKTRADEALADQAVILLDEKAPIATGPTIPEE